MYLLRTLALTLLLSIQVSVAMPARETTSFLPTVSAVALQKSCADCRELDRDSYASSFCEEQQERGVQLSQSQDQRLSYEKVTDVFTSQKEQTLVYLTLANGEQLTATEGHPFKTLEGWRDAVMLKKGGKLLLKGGDADSEPAVEITEIRTERKTLPAYNIEVANAHTYFVGDEGALVHNGFGSYTCHFSNGMKYHGKGDWKRAMESAKQKMKDFGVDLDFIDWTSAKNDRDSFNDEDKRIQRDGGIGSKNGNLNKIHSPGKKMR